MNNPSLPKFDPGKTNLSELKQEANSTDTFIPGPQTPITPPLADFRQRWAAIKAEMPNAGFAARLREYGRAYWFN